MRGSLALYAVPLLGLLVGAAAGQDLAQRLLIGDTELVSIAAGFLGLAGGFAWVWRFTRRVADDADCPVERGRLWHYSSNCCQELL